MCVTFDFHLFLEEMRFVVNQNKGSLTGKWENKLINKYPGYVVTSVPSFEQAHQICICRQYADDIDNVRVWRQCAETKLCIIGYARSVRDDTQMMCTYAHNMRMT